MFGTAGNRLSRRVAPWLLPVPSLPLHCVPEKQTKDKGKSNENRVGRKAHHEE
jgi:hypothetical protein